MRDTEPVEDNRAANLACKRKGGSAAPISAIAAAPAGLREIFDLYGRKVAGGEWRDYGIDFTPQKAVFSVYRRACEYALYRIEKNPRLARKQGAYSVVTATGLVLQRGHDLRRVIAALDTRLKLVSEGIGGDVSFARNRSNFAGLRHQVPCADGTIQGKSTVTFWTQRAGLSGFCIPWRRRSARM
jgi:Protein of unknown function (DUF2794)